MTTKKVTMRINEMHLLCNLMVTISYAKQSGPKALILQITISTLDFDLAKVQLFHSSFADAVDEMASDFFSYTQFNET